MRKFFCLFLVVFLICALSISAFAAGTGYKRYAPIQFDTLYTGANWVQSDPWVGNVIGHSTDIYDGVCDYYAYEIVNDDTDAFYVFVDTYSSFMLSGGDQILDMSYLESFYFQFWVDIDKNAGGYIDYSFQVVLPSSEGNEYEEIMIPFSGTFTVDSGVDFALGSWLKHEIQRVTTLPYVRIRSISLTFRIGSEYVMPEGEPYYQFFYEVSPRGGDGLWNAWWQQFDWTKKISFIVNEAVTEIQDVSFLDWLFNAASGFFGTPLFGDFSLGGLLCVVLCIGLIGVLIKVLS